MFFKNLMLYRLAEPTALDAWAREPLLETCSFRPCGGLEPFSYGFDAPLGRMRAGGAVEEEALVHAASGRMLVCARREERLLPAAVVRAAHAAVSTIDSVCCCQDLQFDRQVH